MTIWTVHPDTLTIARVFASCSIGELVTFDQISDAVGWNILKRRYMIYAAKELAAKEHGASFETVRGSGFRRVPGREGIVGEFTTRMAQTRRGQRKTSRHIGYVVERTNDLDPETLRLAARYRSVLGLIEHIATPRNQPDVANEGDGAVPMSPVQTAAAFMRKMGARPTLA